jgi:23S rRNA (guanine745-N1)-methyltransferase
MSLASSLCCPLCREPLTQNGNSLACTNRHSYDRARQGYYHLLPVQNKRSLAPGDDANMVAGRREFLELGHYQPLSEAINQLLLSQLPQGPARVLDCGCGEGYYSARLADRLTDGSELIGLDISKAAIRSASQRSKTSCWIVASSRELPVCDHSQDALLCLFSPLEPAAFHRALKPGGLLLVATTGTSHLLELRQQIYDEVKRSQYDPQPKLAEHFEPLAQNNVSYRFNLESSKSIRQLLAMTPHQWRSSPESQARLDSLTRLELGLDINLHLLRAKEPNDDRS